MAVNNSVKPRGIWLWPLAILIMVISFLGYAIVFFQQGYQEEGIRQAIRLSARFSVVLFSIAFAGSGIHQYFPNSFTYWIFRNRKFFGICFAFNHLIHLLFLFILQKEFHPVFDLANGFSLMAGGIAYLFIVLMLLTSFSFFEKMISWKNWKRLHTVGGYWIWTVFMSSNIKRVFRGEWSYTPVVVLLIIVLLFRFWKWRQEK